MENGNLLTRENSVGKGLRTTVLRSVAVPLAPNEPYRGAIGTMLYISTRTRPDISFAFGVLSVADCSRLAPAVHGRVHGQCRSPNGP